MEHWRPIQNAILLGDSGYPVKEWLIPPLLRPITDAELKFNIAHKKTRQIVENSFGILKKRFACLEKLRVDPVFAGEIIKCCCILHNLLLKVDPEDSDDEENNVDPNIESEAETDSEANETECEKNRNRLRLITLFV